MIMLRSIDKYTEKKNLNEANKNIEFTCLNMLRSFELPVLCLRIKIVNSVNLHNKKLILAFTGLF